MNAVAWQCRHVDGGEIGEWLYCEQAWHDQIVLGEVATKFEARVLYAAPQASDVQAVPDEQAAFIDWADEFCNKHQRPPYPAEAWQARAAAPASLGATDKRDAARLDWVIKHFELGTDDLDADVNPDLPFREAVDAAMAAQDAAGEQL